MFPRYFQGRSVQGQVSSSGARNFGEVVEKFRIAPVIELTRQTFLALDKKRRNEIKQVPFFVPAAFRSDPSDRRYEKATHCNLIFLDLDESKDGKCPAAPFVSNPESLYTALAGYNFAAHTTASSTPEKPRMRIVVDAEAIPLSFYARAVATVGMLLGLSSITTESKVAVQPMFLPTLFADSTDEDHPLIAHRVDARAFVVGDIAESLPDEFAEAAERPAAQHGPDALFFLRAPVPEITLTTAREALWAVDADCSYHEWLECAAALRHQFHRDQAEEAYQLFDEWSQEGKKYGSDTETRAKWDSLRPTPVGRMPITIRSLLHRAQAAGWDDKKVKESSFTNVMRWIEEAPTISILMEQGIQNIMAAPLLSSTQEGVLVYELVKKAKKRFAYVLSVADVRKDMGKIRAEIRAKSFNGEKTKEPAWARGVVYVAAANDFYRHRTGEKYKVPAFNASYSRHLLPTEDQLKEQGLPITASNLAKPIVDPNEYALNYLEIPTFYDYTYDPSAPLDMIVMGGGKKFLNIYIPSYPELDPVNSNQAGHLFRKHLSNLIAEESNRQILTDFMAFHVQFPGKKIRWAVLIQGAEGAGKTYLAKVMMAVLGAQHVKIIDGSAVQSGFNEWAFGHQLVVMEEIRVQGSSRFEIMNTLKPLITNDEISVNEKFRSNRKMPNISNYMMFTNQHNALALTPQDRRYFVVKSPLQSKDQVKALGGKYFSVLFDFLQEHPGAMREFFHDWQISPDFCADGDAPRTKYAADLIADSASDLVSAVRRLLLEGDHPLIQFDIVSATTLREVVLTEEGLRAVTAQQIAQVLREEGLHLVERTLIGEDRHYLWAREGVNGSAIGTARERVQKNQKNLCMQVLF